MKLALSIKAELCPRCNHDDESRDDAWRRFAEAHAEEVADGAGPDELARRHPHLDAAFLCGVCEDSNAYVVVSDELVASRIAHNDHFYGGTCSVCGHSVFLGAIYKSWSPGPDLGEILALEVNP